MPFFMASKSWSDIDGVRSATIAMSRGFGIPPLPHDFAQDMETTSPVVPLGIPIAGAK